MRGGWRERHNRWVYRALYAGADVREPFDAVARGLPPEYREVYLLEPDVAVPLTADAMIWLRSPEDEAAGGALPWIDVDDVLARSANYQRGGVVVAYAALVNSEEAEDHLRRRTGVEHTFEPREAWRFLGYDVVDDGWVSGLCNCGYEPDELRDFRTRWRHRLNEHGLLTSVEEAFAMRDETDARVQEHSPFQVLGLWVVAELAMVH